MPALVTAKMKINEGHRMQRLTLHRKSQKDVLALLDEWLKTMQPFHPKDFVLAAMQHISAARPSTGATMDTYLFFKCNFNRRGTAATLKCSNQQLVQQAAALTPFS